jgi:lipoprotein-anchoring transpeptidase ErfK/SrfK
VSVTVRAALLALLACAATALAGCSSGQPAAQAIPPQTVVVTLPAPAPAPAPDVTVAPAPAEPSPPARAAARPVATVRPTIHLLRSTVLRDRPGGRAIGRVTPRTEFDSPTVLPVVAVRGDWLGVVTAQLPNGRIGWISAAVRYQEHRNRWQIDVSLRHRRVAVRHDGRVVQRFPVAIGSEGTPTPTGRFAVTDKLLTGSASSPYGCCILALSGHQTATPQGWGGGDRIAIHATNLPQTIGTRASAGCLRAPTDAIRRAVGSVPIGTLVTIRA